MKCNLKRYLFHKLKICGYLLSRKLIFKKKRYGVDIESEECRYEFFGTSGAESAEAQIVETPEPQNLYLHRCNLRICY